MKMSCPKEQFGEIYRYMLLIFDYCKTDEELRAYQAAVRNIRGLKEVIEKRLKLNKCCKNLRP